VVISFITLVLKNGLNFPHMSRMPTRSKKLRVIKTLFNTAQAFLLHSLVFIGSFVDSQRAFQLDEETEVSPF
jgi:hypothetical protein